MFNLQMIKDANLEDPRDLYDRGEWTWDKFAEYCQALTKDTNGDGIIDVYGFGGFQQEWFEAMLMSNGTYVASNGTREPHQPRGCRSAAVHAGHVPEVQLRVSVRRNRSLRHHALHLPRRQMRLLARRGLDTGVERRLQLGRFRGFHPRV